MFITGKGKININLRSFKGEIQRENGQNEFEEHKNLFIVTKMLY